MAKNLTMASAVFGAGKFGQGRSGGYGSVFPAPITGNAGNADWLSYTVEFWFKTTATTQGYIIYQQQGLQYYMESSGWVTGKLGNEGIAGQSYPKNDGNWHHVAIYADGVNGQASGAQMCFIDGIILQENWPYSSAWGSANYNAFPLFIGAKDDGSMPFDGIIDELVFTLGKKYPGNFTPPAAPVANDAPNLLALYHFNGDGADSAGVAEVVPTAPAAPTNVVATVGSENGTASVAFTAPANNGGAAISSYTVTASTGQTAAGGASPIVVSGLASVATTFTVTATNSIGTGPASSASNSITPTAAPLDNFAPTFVSATTSVDGTSITITFSEALAAFTPDKSAFTLAGKTIAGINRNGAAITLTGIAPAYVFGDVVTVSYAKPATNQLRDAAGNEVASFGPVGVTNARPAPPPPGTIIKTFGTAAGSDYPDLNAAIDYANTIDCAATGQKIILKATSPVTSVNKAVGTNGNNDCYIQIQPLESLSFAALNPTGAINETVSGLKMTIGPNNSLRLGRSARVTGFIIDITTTNGIETSSLGSGSKGSLRNNIILPNAWGAIGTGNYVAMQFLDNLFIRTVACGGKFINGAWNVEARRNTFVLKAGATADMAHDGGWDWDAAAENNAYYGFSGDPIPNNFPNCSNCVTNATLSYTSLGITSDKTNPFFVGANDYRASTALIGKANYYAQSTADLRGDNRGPVADVGAIEGTPSLPFPRATVTSQAGPDGSSLTINFSYINTADSATVMLIPFDKESGAVKQGPFAATLDTVNKTGAIIIDDIIPGRYQAPSLLVANADGAIAATGTVGFEILGMDSAAEDTAVSGPATAVVWTVPAAGTMAVPSTNITVGLNGTSAATIRVTPSDSGAGGTFTPAYLDIVNGAGGTFTYTRPTAGTSTLTLTNNGNLTNPATAQFVAAAPPAQAPTISIATATASIMSGKTATLSGPVNLQGDGAGTVAVFADPQPSGTPLALGAAFVADGIHSKQATIPPGLYQFRVVATANGLTATVKTGNVRVLKLVGNFNLPSA